MGNVAATIENIKRAVAMVVAAAMAALTLFTPTPVGIALLITAVFTAFAWPRPESAPLGTSAEKIARQVKEFKTALFHPRSFAVWNLGDPGTAQGHTKQNQPRNRISGYIALYLAALTAHIDLYLSTVADAHHPLTAVLTFPFAYLLYQCAAHAKRATTIETETAPAVLYEPERFRFHLSSHKPLAFIAAAATFALAYAAMSFLKVPLVLQLTTSTQLALGAFSVPALRSYFSDYLLQWRTELQTRAEWDTRWGEVPKARSNPPIWLIDHEIPADSPTHKTSTFAFRTGSDFSVFDAAAPQLGPALASDMILVSPMPSLDETGKPIPGSTQYCGFTVTWALQPLGHKPHLRTDLPRETQMFAARWAVVNACQALRLGRPELAAARTLTARDDPHLLIETQWKLPPQTTYETITSRAADLKEKLEVEWLRVGRRNNPDGTPSEFVSIVYGDHPNDIKLRPRDASELRQWFDQLDWAAWCRAARLVGTDGQPPQLLSKRTNDRQIHEMEFTVPQGFSIPDIKKQVPALMGTSGHGYIAVEKLSDATKFRMVAGIKDPLDRAFLFTDYPQILTEAIPGRPRLDWAIGPGADGELMVYRWDNDLPHMLVAGATGMGKSSVLNNMILQIAHNCTPQDLQFRFIEPKNELGQFANFEHVTHYVDAQTPGDTFENVAMLYEDLRAEMDRRFKVMVAHGALKLSEARYKARQAGSTPENPHPLDMPYIVCVMEECSTYLGKCLPKDKEARDAVLVHATELARKARAAGIYLVFATQYPTNENLPSTIRQQCRRVGLGVNTQIASMVIIDEPGLEDFNVPGRGLMTHGKGYREFRALYLRKPDEDNPDEPDDRKTVIQSIQTVEDRVFGPIGSSKSSELPPPPADIWDVAR